MRKYNFISALLCVTLFLGACSKLEDEVGGEVSSNTTTKLTKEEAILLALDFVNNVEVNTRGVVGTKTVSNVDVISTPSQTTRLGDGTGTDSLFYIVNFTDSAGFVITTINNDTDNHVICYIEEGSYSNNDTDTTNNGFEAYIDAMVEHETFKRNENEDMGTTGSGGSSTKKKDAFTIMRPLLSTKWNQRSPYNKYCNNCPTGCVPTAVSQICSYLRKPQTVKWRYNNVSGYSALEWDKITATETPEGIYADQVAHLMRFWGIAFGADYSSGGTSVNSGNAMKTMRTLGFNVNGLNDYNTTNVINDLNKGDRVVFMRGDGRYYHVGFVFRKYVDGHAWVVDGFIKQVKSNKEYNYLHCNWGWGDDRNGYFLENGFNAEQNPPYKDDGTATRSDNFRYNLKTATIW